MRVTLHFPSAKSFRLWCQAFSLLRDRHSNGTLHRDDKLLGHYRPPKITTASLPRSLSERSYRTCLRNASAVQSATQRYAS